MTALQLLTIAVLNDWGVHPQSVLGHSSGEIAAAAAAGRLTPEEAIKIAYYRGKAAVDLQYETEDELGMLAVGLGRDDVQIYLLDAPGLIQIACVNSPNSVTLSGKVAHLETIGAKIKADGHFARLLQVELAYHSHFVTNIAAHYRDLLLDQCENSIPGSTNIAMFSSVTGRRLDSECDSGYWESNMVSPVLFQQAAEEMVKGEDGADLLIEIGPSGALAGPLSQIKKALGAQGSSLEYFAALKRGPNAVNAI